MTEIRGGGDYEEAQERIILENVEILEDRNAKVGTEAYTDWNVINIVLKHANFSHF